MDYFLTRYLTGKAIADIGQEEVLTGVAISKQMN